MFYDDVREGDMIGPLLKTPTKRQLVMWAGASEDFNEAHYDKDTANQSGFPRVIVHGRLKTSFLGQLMTDWIGQQGELRKISCRYGALDFVDAPLVCRGQVKRKSVANGEHYIECDLWIENEKGLKTTQGNALVALPSRGKPD